MSTPTIKKIQKLLGADPDGVWGPKSQDALNGAIKATSGPNPVLKKIQAILKVDTDGFWGPISQEALNKEFGGGGGGLSTKYKASSFADPGDVVAFRKCKATGKTDRQCFAVGDNGVGQFGKVTAQTHTPMVALHANDMKARWGSIAGAAHRLVVVSANGKTVTAAVEDRMSSPGRIDLNPATAAALGLNPPFLVNCTWAWA